MKKIISILTAIFVTAAVLTGCGAKESADNSKVIKIGATSNPHAIILEKIKQPPFRGLFAYWVFFCYSFIHKRV